MATQLEVLKVLLPEINENDTLLQFYLDTAGDVICDIRNSTAVEPQYLSIQVQIAVELYSKRGVEGQTSHSENGIDRTYEKSDISDSLLRRITPVVKTHLSKKREIT